MLWVDHGLAPRDVMDAPGPVVEAAIRRIVERQEAKEKQQQTRDDAEAWSRMHEQLQRGG